MTNHFQRDYLRRKQWLCCDLHVARATQSYDFLALRVGYLALPVFIFAIAFPSCWFGWEISLFSTTRYTIFCPGGFINRYDAVSFPLVLNLFPFSISVSFINSTFTKGNVCIEVYPTLLLPEILLVFIRNIATPCQIFCLKGRKNRKHSFNPLSLTPNDSRSISSLHFLRNEKNQLYLCFHLIVRHACEVASEERSWIRRLLNAS